MSKTDIALGIIFFFTVSSVYPASSVMLSCPVYLVIPDDPGYPVSPVFTFLIECFRF